MAGEGCSQVQPAVGGGESARGNNKEAQQWVRERGSGTGSGEAAGRKVHSAAARERRGSSRFCTVLCRDRTAGAGEAYEAVTAKCR